ncbi:hypothetical protein ACIOWI_36300 [Streptomyces sp. NPDC087659]|uniref:hypothetical protein n=1 Tax=Streptomyces sp. NPDC087659 TaxID=3365801 RepID=UPI0037FA86E7
MAEDLGIHPGTLYSWVSRRGATGRPRRTGRRPVRLPVVGCGRASALSWNGCGPRHGEGLRLQ